MHRINARAPIRLGGDDDCHLRRVHDVELAYVVMRSARSSKSLRAAPSLRTSIPIVTREDPPDFCQICDNCMFRALACEIMSGRQDDEIGRTAR